MRWIVTLLLLIALAASSAAAEEEVLRLKDGRFAVGEIVAVDDRGVTVKSEAGEARYDWDALLPISRYEILADRLDPGTAAEHTELASFCLRQRLYPHARREIAVARSLPGNDPKLLAAMADAVDEVEAEEAFARIEHLTAEEEYEEALESIRHFLRDAPQSTHTKKARALVPDLIRRRDALELRLEEEAKEADRLEANEQLAEKLQKILDQVAGAREKAATAYAEALRYHGIGNVTRAKDGYLTAEKNLLAAHQLLRRLQRIARRSVAAEKAEEDQAAIRNKLVAAYVGLARLYVEDRNYKRGIVCVNKALYLDPVNKEALDLRKEVDENRIRRSARGLTNTPGVRVTGGTSPR